MRNFGNVWKVSRNYFGGCFSVIWSNEFIRDGVGDCVWK